MHMEIRAHLIYAPGEAERNRAFIRMFQEEGRRQGISFSYVSLEEYRWREVPEVVLNRTRRPEVSQWYEERGCLVLHDSAIVEISNDKWKTLLYLVHQAEQGALPELDRKKWLPDTLYFPTSYTEGRFYGMIGEDGYSASASGERALDPGKKYSCIAYENERERLHVMSLNNFLERYPCPVIKTVSGHGGKEVAGLGGKGHFERRDWDKSDVLREIEAFLEKFPRENVMMQERIACHHRDVRMYVLGNQFYQGVLRQGKGDFRSNYSLGGEAGAFCPSRKQKKWMEQVLLSFGGHTLGMAGIDFLPGEDGNLYFNELEEMVGSRMLYQVTDRDIVKDYVHWLRRILTLV